MKKQLRPETVETDGETVLTYHWNRWRNEEGDAFISEDPIRDGYNWYGYANANPFKYADGTGLAAQETEKCYAENGYNEGTIASMSGPAYNLANNTVPGTEGPGGATASPTAAEETKKRGNSGSKKIAKGKIADADKHVKTREEFNKNLTDQVRYILVKDRNGKDCFAAVYGQHAWKTKDFGKDFNNDACLATDLLDIVSILYTIETGKPLSFDQAVKTLSKAVKGGDIDFSDAFVNDIQKSINSMASYLGLSSKLTYNEGKGEIAIYALAKKREENGIFAGYNPNEAGHFILCLDPFLGVEKGTNCCFDPDTCKITYWTDDGRCRDDENKDYGIVRPMQGSRGYRGFDIR